MIRALAIAFAAGLALGGLVALWAYNHGASVATMRAAARTAQARAELEGDLARISTANRAAAAQIEAMRATQAALTQQVEDEARQDPAAAGRVPGADSLRRLARRWGGKP